MGVVFVEGNVPELGPKVCDGSVSECRWGVRCGAGSSPVILPFLMVRFECGDLVQGSFVVVWQVVSVSQGSEADVDHGVVPLVVHYSLRSNRCATARR